MSDFNLVDAGARAARDPDWPAYYAAVVRPAHALVASGYCSLEVDGAAAITDPNRPTIWAANHAGWLPLDMAFMGLAGYRSFGSSVTARCLVHDLLYRSLQIIPGLRDTLGKLCLPVSVLASRRQIPPDWLHIGIYPEGAAGNTKPLWRAYQTERFRTGFVRLAASRGARIVPVAIVGGEECAPVAFQIERLRSLLGAPVPVPVCPIPLPTRWKVVFHAPIQVADMIGDFPDTLEAYRAVADHVRAVVQDTLDRETRQRWIPRLRRVVRAARVRAT